MNKKGAEITLSNIEAEDGTLIANTARIESLAAQRGRKRPKFGELPDQSTNSSNRSTSNAPVVTTTTNSEPEQPDRKSVV